MNALVLQCGGPTAVVNVSLAAVVRSWRAEQGGLLFGGRFGLAALRTGAWLRLPPDEPGHSADGQEDGEGWLASLEASSGMALGGGRERLTGVEIGAAVDLLASRSVGTLFLIGGNGTMAAGRAIAARASDAGCALQVVGIPKTIDNDIPCTDVSPGFPSAARFLVDCVRDVAADASSMLGYEDVVLIEAMGRHTGWLAGATTLARAHPVAAPHIVLVPELPVNDAEFLGAVRERHTSSGICIATVAEGVRDPAGVFLAEKPDKAGNGFRMSVERDAVGQVILGRSGGPLPYLAALVRERLGLRCRLVRPDVLQRCSRAHVSPLDCSLAAIAGTAAVHLALAGARPGGIMVALRSRSDEWSTEAVPLAEVRGERTFPVSLQSDAGPLRALLA